MLVVQGEQPGRRESPGERSRPEEIPVVRKGVLRGVIHDHAEMAQIKENSRQ